MPVTRLPGASIPPRVTMRDPGCQALPPFLTGLIAFAMLPSETALNGLSARFLPLTRIQPDRPGCGTGFTDDPLSVQKAFYASGSPEFEGKREGVAGRRVLCSE